MNFDIFYSHRFDLDTPLEETACALATAVEHGKALALLPRLRVTLERLLAATEPTSPLPMRRRPARMRANRALPRVSSH